MLLANAGTSMDHGGVAAQSIVDEAEDDPTLIAVLGMGRQGTRDAMVALDRAHIPMIGTFISATPLAESTTDYYHQVGPTNKRESAVAARYVRTALGARKAHIYYYGDGRDLYSADLRDQIHRAFGREHVEISGESPYRSAEGGTGIGLKQLGRQACDLGADEVAFYAGRAEHIPIFLDGMKSTCEGDYPKVMSGDDATRFVLAHGLSHYPGLSLGYLSFGSSLAWGSDYDAAGKVSGFFVSFSDHYGHSCDQTRDGSAILAYDSVRAFDLAVRNAPLDPGGLPERADIRAGLDKISLVTNTVLRGVSGKIDFGKRGGSVPIDKAVMVLRSGGARPDPWRVLLCGDLPTAQSPPDTGDRCPSPEG